MKKVLLLFSALFCIYTIGISQIDTVNTVVQVDTADTVAQVDTADTVAQVDTADTVAQVDTANTVVNTIENTSNEFWIFTGTTLDLLEGINKDDLYFKAHFLYSVSKKNKAYFYTTIGKNRFFDVEDTLVKNFKDYTHLNANDSIKIAQGSYKSVANIETETSYLTFDILGNASPKNNNSKFLIGGGVQYSLQNIKYNFNNSIINSDTLTYAPPTLDSIYQSAPLLRSFSLKRRIYRCNLTLMHVLKTEKFNVKTIANIGMNYVYFPTQISFNNGAQVYQGTLSMYYALRVEATILKGGLSLGAEALMSFKQPSLYNVYFTKVINFDQISTLFGSLNDNK